MKYDWSDDFNRHNFFYAPYIDSSGRNQPRYFMTRYGFDSIIVYFTGERARKRFLAYWELFTEAEEALQEKQAAQHPEPVDPMPILKEVDATLYKWCVQEGYIVENTEQGLGVNMPFPDGHCEFVPIDVFCMIAFATWDILDYIGENGYEVPDKAPGESREETALDYLTLEQIRGIAKMKKQAKALADLGMTHEQIEILFKYVKSKEA